VQIRNLMKNDFFGFALIVSILLFGGIAAVIYGGKWEHQAKDDLYEVSGVVESFHVKRSYRNRNKMIIQITNHGVLHRLTQDDFTRSIPVLETLRQGDEINTLVAPDVIARDIERVWGIRRGDEILLSYEQTLELKKTLIHQRVISIVTIVATMVLLHIAIKLWLKRRASAR